MLGEELAALQRSEDIAQGDVVRRPRQFETASRTEPSADQSGCRHQREKPANHDRICIRAFRHILRPHDLAWIGGQSRQQMNANGKSGARSHRSLVSRRAPILQSRSRSPLRVNDGANLLRAGRKPRPPARLRVRDRRLDSNRGRRLTKRRRQSRCRRRGSVDDRRQGGMNDRRRRRRGRVDRRRRRMRHGRRRHRRRRRHAHRRRSRTRRERGERRWRRSVKRRRRNRSARRDDRRLSCEIGLRRRIACWQIGRAHV